MSLATRKIKQTNFTLSEAHDNPDSYISLTDLKSRHEDAPQAAVESKIYYSIWHCSSFDSPWSFDSVELKGSSVNCPKPKIVLTIANGDNGLPHLEEIQEFTLVSPQEPPGFEQMTLEVDVFLRRGE